MIRYTLKCSDGHSFDSWFKSADAFDALSRRGLLSCTVCGGEDVQKAMMAPQVKKKSGAAETAEPAEAPVSLSGPATQMEAALAAFRKHLDAHSTYVGSNFAQEARSIHLGEAPERLIHGEAKPEEAKALIDDGVPVAPLPVMPKARRN
ncbi:DUF1178 family protein [Alterinioella nitratireducens]|jgi:hypothetical protein|uniref:DUF1178 family protein n=1 Tax=Alterinioella nitratireducens TaxID=2735915 RepID=UPI00155642B3|nr:DUF1178 family protein [Alterinioella nitratireducens]NPD20480.1 DUF1178 family protein [Alterinioella nitratireducens]|tara:strand:- start:55 stop:501 length:447 start_codon:yes stop_codon:yes gene_type:complete